MSYLSSTLLKDEQVVHLTKPHWIVFWPSLVSLLVTLIAYGYGPRYFNIGIYFFNHSIPQLLVLACIAFTIYQFLQGCFLYYTCEYGITNKRVLMKAGFIGRDSLEIFLSKIEAVNVDQTIMGRLLGYGSIIIVGTGGTQDPFLNVPDPLYFRRLAQQQIDLQEQKREVAH